MAMATSSIVKVTEICRVKPAPNPSEKLLEIVAKNQNPSENLSKTVATNNDYFPLTFFDVQWLRFPPTQRVFFYEIENLSPDVFYNTILPKLKNSLSLTLQHYPSLAGNITWHPQTGKPVIRYDPAEFGVFLSVAVADSSADFHSLSTHDVREAKHLHALLPEFHVSETEATVLSLQVTLFPSYGFSIGYCAHHVSMDGKSNSMFLKSWTTICRVGTHPQELMPVLERSLIDDPLDICEIFTNHWMKTTENNKRSLVPMELKMAPGLLFRGTFRLTPDQIGQIKLKINIKSHVSSFTAVCAYVWRCLVKAEESDLIRDHVYLNISVDCRGRLKPPIPGNYFGNCVTYRFAKAKVASLVGNDGLGVAAGAIKEAIESLNEGSSIVKGAEKWLSEASSTHRNEKVYGIAASTWFDLYGSDFGWGRPKMAELVSIDRNSSFSLCDGRDGNDVNIEIGIVLNKLNMGSFASLFTQGLAIH